MINFFKKISSIFIAVLFITNVSAELSVKEYANTKNEDEALFLRRIVEFWQENNTDIVKAQIHDYLKGDKPTEFSDYLKTLLGNIYYSEKKYDKASEIYQQISKKEMQEEVLANFVQSYYELQNFEAVIERCSENMNFIAGSNKKLSDRFYYLLGDSYYQLALTKNDEKESLLFARKAKPYFEKLSLENHKIKPCLAHIFYLEKDFPKAAELYLAAADKLLDQKEEFLFQAATLQVNFDKEKAVESFSQVCRIGKDKLQEASFNKMLLLVDLGRYNDLLLAKEDLVKNLNEDQQSKLHFLLGKAYLGLNDFKRAGEELAAFLESKDATEEESLTSLNMLLSCAEKRDIVSFADLAITKLEENFKENNLLPVAYFLRGRMHKKQSDFSEAKKDFVCLEKNFPDFAKKEDFLIEAGSFYYQTKDFLQSRLLFKTFVENYHSHDLSPLAWRYFVNSSIQLEAAASGDKLQVAKEVLVEDLESFLAEKELSNETEKMEYGFILVKTLYDLEKWQDSLDHLNNLVLNYPQMGSQATIQLYLGSLKQKIDVASPTYIENLEAALLLDKDKSLDHVQIHLNLFNTYLDLYKKEEKFMDLAAEHLYIVQADKNVAVMLDNLLWLLDYYYKIVESHMANFENQAKDIFEYIDHAQNVVERIVAENRHDSIIPLNKLFLEGVLFKKAKLLGFEGKKVEEKEYLNELKDNYERALDVNWQMKDKVYFALAEKAIEEKQAVANNYLDQVIKFNERSYYGLFAKLEKVRLKLKNMDKSKRLLQHNTIYEDLSLLKNIKLQKSVQTEPVHLEAGLDYITFETEVIDGTAAIAKQLQLLKKLKVDFTDKTDIVSKEYQNSLKLHPDKKALVEAYFAYINAEIMHKEALVDEIKKEKLEKAAAMHQQMAEKKQLVTPYLKAKNKEALVAIKKELKEILAMNSLKKEAQAVAKESGSIESEEKGLEEKDVATKEKEQNFQTEVQKVSHQEGILESFEEAKVEKVNSLEANVQEEISQDLEEKVALEVEEKAQEEEKQIVEDNEDKVKDKIVDALGENRADLEKVENQ